MIEPTLGYIFYSAKFTNPIDNTCNQLFGAIQFDAFEGIDGASHDFLENCVTEHISDVLDATCKEKGLSLSEGFLAGVEAEVSFDIPASVVYSYEAKENEIVSMAFFDMGEDEGEDSFYDNDNGEYDGSDDDEEDDSSLAYVFYKVNVTLDTTPPRPLSLYGSVTHDVFDEQSFVSENYILECITEHLNEVLDFNPKKCNSLKEVKQFLDKVVVEGTHVSISLEEFLAAKEGEYDDYGLISIRQHQSPMQEFMTILDAAEEPEED